jgi:hypothetical protein
VSNIGGDRPLRVCDLCGGVDDHPRHSLAGTVPGQAAWPEPSEDVVNQVLETAPAEQRARLMRDLMDTATTDRHLDCCAAAGCPGEGEFNCAYRIAGAEGKTGRALLNHLTKER